MIDCKSTCIHFGLTERQVERIVASLKKQGVLIRHGASKNGFWEVVDKT